MWCDQELRVSVAVVVEAAGFADSVFAAPSLFEESPFDDSFFDDSLLEDSLFSLLLADDGALLEPLFA